MDKIQTNVSYARNNNVFHLITTDECCKGMSKSVKEWAGSLSLKY